MTEHSPEYTHAVQTALGWTFDGTHWWDEHGFQTFDDLPPVTEADRRALSRLVAVRLGWESMEGCWWYGGDSNGWFEPNCPYNGGGLARIWHPAGTTPQAWGQALAAADAVQADGCVWGALGLLTRNDDEEAAWWWLNDCPTHERGGFLCAAIVRATDD